jgi:2-oxoglutarate dehydrogenase E1 component
VAQWAYLWRLQLIAAYRNRGHQKARLDPLGLMQREAGPRPRTLRPRPFPLRLQYGLPDRQPRHQQGEATLGEMVEAMEATYCGSIGAEYMHIVDTAEKRWIQQRLESVRGKPQFTPEARKHILERLTAAEGLENFWAANMSAPSVSVWKAVKVSSRWWMKSSSVPAAWAPRKS